MPRRNATLIATRQWALYNYLDKCFKEDPARWISPREIYNNVPGYIWNEKAYDKCQAIRDDKKFLNSQDEVDQLIVMKDRYIKIGTKEEVIQERDEHLKRLINQAVQIKNFNHKYRLDGQFKLLDNRGNEMTENAKPYRETFSKMAESR